MGLKSESHHLPTSCETHLASLRIAPKLHSIFTKMNYDNVHKVHIYYLGLIICTIVLKIGNPHCMNATLYLVEFLFGVGEALDLCWAVIRVAVSYSRTAPHELLATCQGCSFSSQVN